MIEPGGIPSIPGDMDVLAAHASALSQTGGQFADTGTKVNATWQGLAGVYRAPEVGQLLAATAPVRAITASVGDDVQAAGRALAAYAAEVKQIKARLETLRAQAVAFVHSVAGQHDWQSDSGKVDQNNQLINAVDAEVAAFFDAQRRCANAINALYGGQQYRAGDGNGAPGQFGFTARELQQAAQQGQKLPWGSDEQHHSGGGLLGDIGSFFGGVWDGAKQMVTGLGALLGYGNGKWSWSTAGQAWEGLGKFTLAIAAYSPMTSFVGADLDQTVGIPGLRRGELGQTLVNAGKGMVAWDEWKRDPSRAAGTATFNIVTAIVGTKGAGAALKGVGTAAEASDVATVARVGAVMTRGGELIGSLPTVRDLATGITDRLPGFRLADLHPPEINLPTEHVDTHATDGVPETQPDSIGQALGHAPHADAAAPAEHTPVNATPAPSPVHAHVGAGHDTPPAHSDDHTPSDTHTAGDHGRTGESSNQLHHAGQAGGHGHSEPGEVTTAGNSAADHSVLETGPGHAVPEGFRPEDLANLPHDVPPRPEVHGDPIPITRHSAEEALAARHDLQPNRVYTAPDGSRFYTGHTGRVEWVETSKGTKPNWNPELNHPQPNTTYLVDGRYLYVTEDLGRTVHRDGILGFDHRSDAEAADARDLRPHGSQRTAGEPDRHSGDVGSHGFGRKFGGPAERINMDALTREINSNKKNQFGYLERQWEKLISDDPNTRIRVREWLTYPGDSRRPDTFIVEYTENYEHGAQQAPEFLEFDNE